MKNYKEMKKREENYKTSLGGPIWDSKSFRKKRKVKSKKYFKKIPQN